MAGTLIALERDTIYECVFEVRFVPANDSAADLLPGMMFAALRDRFVRSASLPFSQIPKAVRDQATLRYQASHVLDGKDSRLLLGQRMAALSFPRPYQGWKAVRARITECVDALLGTALIGPIERTSLKYVNVLSEGKDQFDLSQLRLKVEVGDLALLGRGFSLTAEVEKNGCICIVQITGGASVEVSTPAHREKKDGVLVTVDTIYPGPFEPDFRSTLEDVLRTVKS
jgi:uncharacterized protein (TIGR04255 family)